jgi:hypothetical protein
VGRRRDSRSDESVRGYALAIGWHPFDAGDQAGFDGTRERPEIAYLVADPRRPSPTWVPEGSITQHFRTFLSGVPEPDEASGAGGGR